MSENNKKYFKNPINKKTQVLNLLYRKLLKKKKPFSQPY